MKFEVVGKEGSNFSYPFTKKELEYLSKRVKKLHAMAKRICREKINSYDVEK